MDVVLMSTYLITSGRRRLSPFPQGEVSITSPAVKTARVAHTLYRIGWRPEHCVKAGLQHSGGAETYVRLQDSHGYIGHARHRQEMHWADHSREQGLQGDVGAAVMPTQSPWAGFT